MMHCEKWKIGGKTCHLMIGDSFKIRAGNKDFFFDFHGYLGPMMMSKRGNAIQTFPPQSSPFWDALHWWLKQGKQIDADGWCLFRWETEPVQILKHLGGKHYQVLATRTSRTPTPAR